MNWDDPGGLYCSGVPIQITDHLAADSLPRFCEKLSIPTSLCFARGGVVCTNSAAWQDKMIFAQKALGLQPSPLDCWLTMRGLKTEAVRMERHCENALRFARFLEEEGAASSVRYPFLESHPQYDLARKHCGMQREWRIGLGKLQEKCGSSSTLRLFRQQIRRIADEDELGTACHTSDDGLGLQGGELLRFIENEIPIRN